MPEPENDALCGPVALLSALVEPVGLAGAGGTVLGVLVTAAGRTVSVTAGCAIPVEKAGSRGALAEALDVAADIAAAVPVKLGEGESGELSEVVALAGAGVTEGVVLAEPRTGAVEPVATPD